MKEGEAAKVDAWERYETIENNESGSLYMERRVHIYRRRIVSKGGEIVTY